MTLGTGNAADDPRVAIKPANMPGLFITGTGTDVGKTMATAALAGALTGLGVNVGICKPVATGCRPRGAGRPSMPPGDDDYDAPDAELAARAAGLSTDAAMLRYLSPLRFVAPTAAYVSARMEGRAIHYQRIADAMEYWRSHCDFLLVEGAGGFLAPIDDSPFVIADLAVQLALPLLVVTGIRLGTLNDTLLTVEAIRRRGLKLAGLVLNCIPEHTDLTMGCNIQDLPRFSQTPVVAALPEVKQWDHHTIPPELVDACTPFARQFIGQQR